MMTATQQDSPADVVSDPIDEEFEFLNEQDDEETAAVSPLGDMPEPPAETNQLAGETIAASAETIAAVPEPEPGSIEEHTPNAGGLLDGLNMGDGKLVEVLNNPDHETVIDADFADVEALRRENEELRRRLYGMYDQDEEIKALSLRVRRLASEKVSAKSAVEEAKGELKAATERYESALMELRAALEEQAAGQPRLPFSNPQRTTVASKPAVATPTPAAEAQVAEAPVVDASPDYRQVDQPAPAVDEGAKMPITNLGQKQMIAMYDKNHWSQAKDREEPYGMTENEISTLESSELNTIGDLEKLMRESKNWERDFKGLGPKKVAKLIESLRLFRVKFPMPA